MHQTPENIGCAGVLDVLLSCLEYVIGSRPWTAASRCAQQKAPGKNAQFSLTANGAQRLRILPHLPSPDARKTRVVAFGSFMGGCHVLKELLSGELADRVRVTGVATDDPTQPFTHANVRLWKYAHTRKDELITPRFLLCREAFERDSGDAAIPKARHSVHPDSFQSVNLPGDASKKPPRRLV